MALDLKPGDEVITTPFTFIATVEVICLLGLVPVFADVDPSTFNIDPFELKKKITNKTKAIIPVHLFGQCADMDSIMEIAEEHDLFVIEDTAQALGASYAFRNGVTKQAGTMGIIGCTSFFPSKNLGAYGDGGAIFTSDIDLGDKIAAIVNHGMKKRYHYEYKIKAYTCHKLQHEYINTSTHSNHHTEEQDLTTDENKQKRRTTSTLLALDLPTGNPSCDR
jgi:dTDP-4-amino-4,6-dideoxygalactose transaminase